MSTPPLTISKESVRKGRGFVEEKWEVWSAADGEGMLVNSGLRREKEWRLVVEGGSYIRCKYIKSILTNIYHGWSKISPL